MTVYRWQVYNNHNYNNNNNNVLLLNELPGRNLITRQGNNWFAIGATCVKWSSVFSGFFSLPCGIRQGGLLSPYLFALYVDGIAKKIESANVGCYVRQTCLLLYADDIVLMAPTVSALQQLFYICESELDWLDLRINASKSAVTRIGPCCASPCCDIITTDNRELNWAERKCCY